MPLLTSWRNSFLTLSYPGHFPDHIMSMDLLQDMTAGPPSPSKGKGVDASNKTWRASWWDFYPLLERPKRCAHILVWQDILIIISQADAMVPIICHIHRPRYTGFDYRSPFLILQAVRSAFPAAYYRVAGFL